MGSIRLLIVCMILLFLFAISSAIILSPMDGVESVHPENYFQLRATSVTVCEQTTELTRNECVIIAAGR